MYLLAKLKGDYLDACLQTVIKIHLEASAKLYATITFSLLTPFIIVLVLL